MKVNRIIDVKTITIRLVDSTEDKVLHFTRLKSVKRLKPVFVAKNERNSYIKRRRYTVTDIGIGPGIIHKCTVKHSGTKKAVIVRSTGPGAPFGAKGHIMVLHVKAIRSTRQVSTHLTEEPI